MRKVLTRWIACILSLVMMIETCPAAWAEETEILPPGAIEAARALAGTDEDADYFYEGMAPEISWNARMLADWIESILSHEMYAVQNSWSDLEKNLCTMEEEAPDLYGQMTSGENAAFAEKAGEMFILSEDLRETIRYYQDILDEGGEKIESQIASILSADFPFVRVDLYDVGGKIYFGELTFYPWSGYVQFTPDEADFRFGKDFELRKFDPDEI